MINISIIIPHKNSISYLERLLNTLPYNETIEVIIIDDLSDESVIEKLKNINYKKNIKVIYSKGGGPGSARNLGTNISSGKWIIFADSDDYFTNDFLKLTNKFINYHEDIIYFGSGGVNKKTTPTRHLRYLTLIINYLKNPINEDALKFHFLAPWGKMIKRKLIQDSNILFDEILSAEDNLFSVKLAHKADKISATSEVLYYIQERTDSLSKVWGKDHFLAKFYAAIAANQFLCSINKKKYQQSILFFLGRSYKFGIRTFLLVIKELIINKSNLFIGSKKLLYYKTVIKNREG